MPFTDDKCNAECGTPTSHAEYAHVPHSSGKSEDYLSGESIMPKETNSYDQLIERFTAWAGQEENVRAAIIIHRPVCANIV